MTVYHFERGLTMIRNNILMENVEIPMKMRNFSGQEGAFNPAGRRNFCVFLDAEIASILEKDGWNVKWLQPKNEGEERKPFLQVTIRYGKMPPKIVLVSKRGKTLLDEASLSILDFAEIDKADILIRPYNWEVRGETGVKAYLKSLYVTIPEDDLDSKYYDLPDSAVDNIGGCGNCEVCDGSCHPD